MRKLFTVSTLLSLAQVSTAGPREIQIFVDTKYFQDQKISSTLNSLCSELVKFKNDFKMVFIPTSEPMKKIDTDGARFLQFKVPDQLTALKNTETTTNFCGDLFRESENQDIKQYADLTPVQRNDPILVQNYVPVEKLPEGIALDEASLNAVFPTRITLTPTKAAK